MTGVAVLIVVLAVVSAAEVRLFGWPWRYWWPVFGLVMLALLAGWVAA